MSMKSMTYGTLPTYDEFCETWDKVVLEGDTFDVVNDAWLGSVNLRRPELYDQIHQAIQLMDKNEADIDGPELSFASCALYVLGFEWI